MSSSLDSTSTSLSTPPLSSPSFSNLPISETTLKELEKALKPLQTSSRIGEQLRNLASYRSNASDSDIPISSIPHKRLASVLVLLHLSTNPETHSEELKVTLTTRSKRMRSHPGETALPGGKFEDGSDKTIEETALREANEEISLPLPPTSPLLHLTNLEPYTSRTLLIVVPCIYFLALPAKEADNWLEERLKGNEDEVEAIFNCSLIQLLRLTSTTPKPIPTPTTQPNGKEDGEEGKEVKEVKDYVYSFEDYDWALSPSTIYRLHSFSSPTFASSITGLTADILIDTAAIAEFGAKEGLGRVEGIGFERRGEGQVGWKEIVKRALRIEKVSSRDVRAVNGKSREGEVVLTR